MFSINDGITSDFNRIQMVNEKPHLAWLLDDGISWNAPEPSWEFEPKEIGWGDAVEVYVNAMPCHWERPSRSTIDRYNVYYKKSA